MTLSDKGICALNLAVVDQVLPSGVKLALAGEATAFAKSAKATVDLSPLSGVSAKIVCNLSGKSDVTLATASGNYILGGTVALDGLSNVSKYALGVGVSSGGATYSVFAEDSMSSFRFATSHTPCSGTKVGTEVKFTGSTGVVSGAVGSTWSSGNVKCKARAALDGVVSLAAETKIGGHVVTAATGFNAISGGEGKFGLSLDLKA